MPKVQKLESDVPYFYQHEILNTRISVGRILKNVYIEGFNLHSLQKRTSYLSLIEQRIEIPESEQCVAQPSNKPVTRDS